MFVEAQNFGSFSSGPSFVSSASWPNTASVSVRVVRAMKQGITTCCQGQNLQMVRGLSSRLRDRSWNSSKAAAKSGTACLCAWRATFDANFHGHEHGPNVGCRARCRWSVGGLAPQAKRRVDVFEHKSRRQKHIKQQSRHPLKHYLSECRNEWQAYGVTVASQVRKSLTQDSPSLTLQAYIRQWKKDGMIDDSKPEPWVPQGGFRKTGLDVVPLRPYPYTEEMVQSTALSRESTTAVKICQAPPLGTPAGWIDRTNMEWMRKAAIASQRQQQLLGGRGVLGHTVTLQKTVPHHKSKSRSTATLVIQGSPAEARAAPLFQSTKSGDVALKRKDASSTFVQDTAWILEVTAPTLDVVLQEIHLHLRQTRNRAVP